MKKNTASQKWVVFAFNKTTNTPVTGDAANITANLRIDGGAANPIDDTNPTELEGGYYVFDITQAETNGDYIVICPSSVTANVVVIGVPGAVWTDTVTATATLIETAVITNAAGVDIAADIIALKSVADLVEDIIRNQLEITDVNGNVVLRADNSVAALYTVSGLITDDSTTTIRKRLE